MKTVKVWDPFVRVFHWTLVLGVIEQLITAGSFNAIHVTAGYALFFLVLARVVWGFIGTRHARFVDFVYPPREIAGYLRGLIARSPKNYLGHNPAGGAMVCLLLCVLLLTMTAGLKTLGAFGKGPLADMPAGIMASAYANGDEGHDDHHDHDHGADAGFWKEIHQGLVGFLIFLVVIHVCGVIVSSVLHKENLILPMITGKKRIREENGPSGTV